MFRDSCALFYNPSGRLVVDEVTVPFKQRVIFKQYIPSKHKCFGINIYKLSQMTGYNYDMSIYLGKDWQIATQMKRVTH
jgi:hypothetical protein